jgi:hypothetical protein
VAVFNIARRPANVFAGTVRLNFEAPSRDVVALNVDSNGTCRRILPPAEVYDATSLIGGRIFCHEAVRYSSCQQLPTRTMRPSAVTAFECVKFPCEAL